MILTRDPSNVSGMRNFSTRSVVARLILLAADHLANNAIVLGRSY